RGVRRSSLAWPNDVPYEDRTGPAGQSVVDFRLQQEPASSADQSFDFRGDGTNSDQGGRAQAGRPPRVGVGANARARGSPGSNRPEVERQAIRISSIPPEPDYASAAVPFAFAAPASQSRAWARASDAAESAAGASAGGAGAYFTSTGMGVLRVMRRKDWIRRCLLRALRK